MDMEAPASKNKASQKKKERSRPSNSNPANGKAKLYSKPINCSSKLDGEAKAKLRTSKDVFNRLKWDSEALDIDVSQLYIGYKDRFLGMCEVKFTDFNPCAEEGDIPFHRIYYFRGGGPPIAPMIGKDGEIAVREDNWPPGAIIYWDRETRLDLIFNSGETFANGVKQVKKPRGQHQVVIPTGYHEVPVYQYSDVDGRWTPCRQMAPTMEDEAFKLISLNVLYEFYEEDFHVPCNRWPYLIDFLEDSDADIIALQEVTPKFLSILESVSWVQEKYFLSDISSVGATIKPYGQLFLTKFQPSNLFHTEHFSRRFTLAAFPFSDAVLCVANVHLISNFKGEASKMRHKQLEYVVASSSQLTSKSQSEPNILIVGDTNFGNEEYIDNSKMKVKIVDLVEHLRQDRSDSDPGWTFSIYENTLAKQFARRTTEARFDRILLNPQANLLEVAGELRVTGKEPIDFGVPARTQVSGSPSDTSNVQHQLYLSDHFALECDFIVCLTKKLEHASVCQEDENKADHLPLLVKAPHKLQTKEDAMSPVHTSAVAIIPPTEVWPKIQAIRYHSDPSYARWPPHINLLYGFIPENKVRFNEAQESFAQALKNMDPIKIRLSKVETFKSGKFLTVYLTSSSSSELEELKYLQRQLESAYPACNEQSSKSGSGFTPHLTIAKLSIRTAQEKEMATKLMEEWQEAIDEGMEFTIDSIFIISRKFNDPFRIRRSIPLGSEAKRPERFAFLEKFLVLNKLVPSAEREAVQSQVLTDIKQLCMQVTQDVSVHLVGSSKFGFHDDSSDIDILICGPPELPHQAFFENLRQVYNSKLDNTLQLVSVVLDTLVPIARFKTSKCLEVDVVYCPCGADNWQNISDQVLHSQSESFVRSIDGIKEVESLCSLIPQEWWPTYCVCMRVVKYWAKQRNIYGQVMGYFSSNTIALLLAKIILDTEIKPEQATAEDLVEEFFEFYSFWKWPSPVQLQPISTPAMFESKVPELMPIHAPSFPYLNRARNVTKSTRSLIQKEISRGSEILGKIGASFEEKWKILCEKEDFYSKYPSFVQIQIICDDLKDVVICEGILSSRLVRLVVDLGKRCNISGYPYPEMLFPAQNSVVALIGCDSTLTPSRNLEDVTRSFKLKLETWTSTYTSGKIQIKIEQLSQANTELQSLRSLEGDAGINKCDKRNEVDTGSVCPEKSQILDNISASSEPSTSTEIFSGFRVGLFSVTVLTIALGSILARRYWK